MPGEGRMFLKATYCLNEAKGQTCLPLPLNWGPVWRRCLRMIQVCCSHQVADQSRWCTSTTISGDPQTATSTCWHGHQVLLSFPLLTGPICTLPWTQHLQCQATNSTHCQCGQPGEAVGSCLDCCQQQTRSHSNQQSSWGFYCQAHHLCIFWTLSSSFSSALVQFYSVHWFPPWILLSCPSCCCLKSLKKCRPPAPLSHNCFFPKKPLLQFLLPSLLHSQSLWPRLHPGQSLLLKFLPDSHLGASRHGPAALLWVLNSLLLQRQYHTLLWQRFPCWTYQLRDILTLRSAWCSHHQMPHCHKYRSGFFFSSLTWRKPLREDAICLAWQSLAKAAASASWAGGGLNCCSSASDTLWSAAVLQDCCIHPETCQTIRYSLHKPNTDRTGKNTNNQDKVQIPL